jgi:hypothetical protein
MHQINQACDWASKPSIAAKISANIRLIGASAQFQLAIAHL